MAQYTSPTQPTVTTRPEREEMVVTNVANLVPLGMSALAFTTAILGCIYAGFIIPYMAGTSIHLIVGAALFYGGIVQILAGMWEFRKNNTAAATLFSAYGGFLVALAVIFIPGFGIASALTSAALLQPALGLLFLCWTIFSAVMLIGSMKNSVGVIVVLALLFLAYLFLTIGELASGNTILLHIGGWLGIICALVGWYAALASMLNASNTRYSLPL